MRQQPFKDTPPTIKSRFFSAYLWPRPSLKGKREQKMIAGHNEPVVSKRFSVLKPTVTA
ncbi:hypothetical protein CULCOIPH003_11310 [Corynebacterium ulcerans]|nr:hypothetical protein CULCOIPH001_08350 [Corynebacterium ulcerans]GJJ38500.1 hypothetical protein CULCOIPH003_11310 [Corynebacterium ulcerans]GJJ40351.1 hypothetical protein CULCOIPH004_07620 [Corynebacterium ulcerans]